MARLPVAPQLPSSRSGHICALALLGLVVAGQARAEETALVEEVTAKSAGVQIMDYLSAGQIVKLGPGESIVIDYLRSCGREQITGGVVTIGVEQSEVAGGNVRREKVECDGGHMQMTAEQASKSGVMVFRSLKGKPPGATPPLTLYGTSPMIDLREGGTVAIERVDQPGEKRTVQIKPGKIRAAPYDCAQHGLALAAGATYRATAGAKQIVFKIADTARDGNSPPVGRLIRF
jgi:hypothetical protein